ncbi:GNAT family N-acetyltransferase [Pseudahrensia aquimaris]|uniref:GNAT family N-acetyltransferase n=1 Tax=Pseudahrensia aquimaris TaxID=744461 RepID=A0ABW3FFP6_9HYPH
MQVRLALSEADIETCFRLRHTVFVEEQGVPEELEIDEADCLSAVHFLGLLDDEPVAAGRMIPLEPMIENNTRYSGTMKIGRLVVVKSHRGRGYGDNMMAAMLDYARIHPAVTQIVLDAQTDALGFYEKLGFKAQGDDFMDAGIPHRHMVKTL